MLSLLNNKKMSKRRGISQVVGTLLMVAIVAAVGSVILFQGINNINDFNYYLSFLTGSKNFSYENVIIEHVRFNPTDNNLDIWIRNTGTVEIEIAKVTMVKMNTQELILNDNPNQIISISELKNINEHPTGIAAWQNPPYDTAEYRISITTASGNSFETMARPFNT